MRYFVSTCLLFLSFSYLAQDIDYSDNYNWANLPSDSVEWPEYVIKDSLSDKVDVFFLYPTLLIDKKDERWNYNIDDSNHRQNVIDNVVKMQASAWASAGEIYVPFYRQAHMRSFRNLEDGGTDALLFAYKDVKAAFQYYLEHHNNGNAIILAGHSQGSILLSELIKEFFDGKPLHDKLVAAYLPGTGIAKDEYSNIRLMKHPDSVGGFVCWNTFKKNYDHPNYHNWYKGKEVINPVTWDDSEIAERDLHKGFYFTNGKMYRESFETHTVDGAIWITTPHFPFRSMSFTMEHYHVGDVNLFWEDIRLNSINRVKSYFNLKK